MPPEFTWYHDISPTGIAFLNSDKIGKQYDNDLLVGDYNGGEIYSFKLNETRTGFVLPAPVADHVSYDYSENTSAQDLYAVQLSFQESISQISY